MPEITRRTLFVLVYQQQLSNGFRDHDGRNSLGFCGDIVYIQNYFVVYRNNQNSLGCWNLTSGIGYQLESIGESNNILSVVGENMDMLIIDYTDISTTCYPEITMTGAYAYIKTED